MMKCPVCKINYTKQLVSDPCPNCGTIAKYEPCKNPNCGPYCGNCKGKGKILEY